MRQAIFATCTLNQWALDFSGNYRRILESIQLAKLKGATYRCGPELEITGYGCGDHFHESDTILHSWEVLVALLCDPICSDIIVDVGMPVMHKNITYNCRVLFLNKNIILIRPKTILCDSSMYRESRWFTAWVKEKAIDDFLLPFTVQDATGQQFAPFGDCVLSTSDTTVGFEICEELWNPQSSHIKYAEDGVEVIVNASGGFHEIDKLTSVVEMIRSTTQKCGGLYLFSNLRGCDGDIVYYHGTSHITLNGEIQAIGKQFSLQEVEVVTACVDLDEVVQKRMLLKNSPSQIKSYPRIEVGFNLSSENIVYDAFPDSDNFPTYKPGEDLTLGPACWLWDFLRRSSFKGIILPLNDEIGSISSAVIVYSLCNLICNSVKEGNAKVLHDLRKIINDPEYNPTSPKELCNILLVTCSLNTGNTSSITAFGLNSFAAEIGSCHLTAKMDSVINTFIFLFLLLTGLTIKRADELKESKSYLPLEKRIQSVMVYLCSELFLWSRNKTGSLLVLGNGHSETMIGGNFVKNGDVCGDISLTAAIGRKNLSFLLQYSVEQLNLSSLYNIADIPNPLNKIKESENCVNNEIEIEKEMEIFARLRRKSLGPFSAFCQLAKNCPDKKTLHEVACRIKKTFFTYSLNRFKVFSIPPAYHVDPYAASNLYLDQRPVLYNIHWNWQFNSIEKEVHGFKSLST